MTMAFIFGKRMEANSCLNIRAGGWRGGERELKLDHIKNFSNNKRRVVPESEVIPGPLTKCNSP